MKRNKLIIAVLVGGLFASIGTVNATVTILSNDSFVETYGNASDQFGSYNDTDFDSFSDTNIPSDYDGFASTSYNVTNLISSEDAGQGASIYSDLHTPMRIDWYMSAENYAESSAADGYISGSSESHFEITFVTDEYYDFALRLEEVDVFGGAELTYELFNSIGDLLISGENFGGEASKYEDYYAAPDEYLLLVTVFSETELSGIGDVASKAAVGNALFEVTTAVPVPAAVWLFATGLLGLVSVRRKKVV